MPAVVIVACGKEYRTAFVSYEDADGDDRTEAAACILAGFRVARYILATGPMPSRDMNPTLWGFPMHPDVNIHIHIARFQRWLGTGRYSERADIYKAITATTRTIAPQEIQACLNNTFREACYTAEPVVAAPAAKRDKAPKVRIPPPASRQLSLF